ncbi:Putative GNAT domain, acyl-CoA N-acyltransferase [Septoria linicola]|uniref:GNAT domain, acyl-CoA N-acyltransferase n=1 Tax=Septoria linicola TaxID=215465 RepID=A0A9Q9AHG3_9PEZI|nr:putative GNAT domain, acyl-CoA N-acyltransferase [Septoria linicola]USW47754.1 Putative GNAT domain, acyl-CoA N-acyltransferase [Septoria linicola]
MPLQPQADSVAKIVPLVFGRSCNLTLTSQMMTHIRKEEKLDDTILDCGGGVSVRKHHLSDAVSCSRHANNRNVWLNLRDRFPHPYTEDSALSWIKHCQSADSHAFSGAWSDEGGATGPRVPTQYAIVINGEAVGAIGLDFGSDVYFRTAELGYWLSEDHWGKGVMGRVVRAFTTWSWQTFDILVRLNAEVVATNIASTTLLERAGFEYEGRRRNAVCKVGVMQDVLIFGALRP